MLNNADKNEGRKIYLKNEYFSRLSSFINAQEKDMYEKYSKIPNRTDFDKDLVILANRPCYRTFGILGLKYLIDKHNSMPTYNYLGLQDAVTLLSTEKYFQEMCTDVLILTGNYIGLKSKEVGYSWVDNNLYELLTLRKDNNRITWLFLNGITTEQFKRDLPLSNSLVPIEKSIVLEVKEK